MGTVLEWFSAGSEGGAGGREARVARELAGSGLRHKAAEILRAADGTWDELRAAAAASGGAKDGGVGGADSARCRYQKNQAQPLSPPNHSPASQACQFNPTHQPSLTHIETMLRSRAHAIARSARINHTLAPQQHHRLLRAAASPLPPPPPCATVVPRASASEGGSNPLASMLSGLFGKGGSGGSNAPASLAAAAGLAAAAAAASVAPPTAPRNDVRFADTAPSWDELRALAESQERQHDLADRGGSFLAPDLDHGPASALALRRLFGAPASAVEIVLYRDHAAWCPYCEKVALVLEEKRIPYEVRKINMRCYGGKPAEFLAKVPSGLLPVLEMDGRVVTESATIMALLEDRHASDPARHRPLMPPRGTAERAEADALLRLERRFFGDWLDWLTGGGGWGGGVDERQQAAARRRFEQTVAAVCAAMPGPGPFFMGLDQPSLVDITFAPMLERAAASLAYYKGWYLRGQGQWPELERWFDAMEARESYAAFRSDFYTHAHDLPPQLGGCTMAAEGQAVAAALDGAGAAWRLPLPPLSPASLPEPFAGPSDDARDRLEAAARLVANHGPIVRFALRGPGRPGARPVSAPLADPSAVPALEHERAADAALRHVAHALLVGVGSKQGAEGGGGKLWATAAAGAGAGAGAGAAGGGALVGGVPEVVAACEYLRDRVGVPRDMRFPAARQLRAHLNWFIDEVRDV